MNQQYHLAKMHQHQEYPNNNHGVGPNTMALPYKVIEGREE